MNGNIVYTWPKGVVGGQGRAYLLTNGNLITFAGKYRPPPEERSCGWVVELDWEGNLIRKLIPPKGLSAHHHFQRLDNARTFVIAAEDIPDEYRAKIEDPIYRNRRFESDAVLEFDENGKIVWEWHAYQYFDVNQLTGQDFYPFDYYPEYYTVDKSIMTSEGRHTETYYNNCSDWTHINTVTIIPQNKWYDGGDKRFKPGNVLINPRNFNRMYIIDKESKDIVWYYTGNFMGGLAHPHDPYMIPNGFPGAGNILIFDNGIMGTLTAHCGRSAVLEVNPVIKQVVWYYMPGKTFFSQYKGVAQRLPNGNTLICESNTGRYFEVTPEKEIVWEYVDSKSRGSWIQRYPYDWCPQLKRVPTPKEIPVIPPNNKDFKISPTKE